MCDPMIYSSAIELLQRFKSPTALVNFEEHAGNSETKRSIIDLKDDVDDIPLLFVKSKSHNMSL